ncbi:MAG: hypothetical protein LC114_15615 [Bryobacterales bacterium]|nr:hypothetical protein [Bryobacterales bacterium]
MGRLLQLICILGLTAGAAASQSVNQWVELARDAEGGRRGGAVRYAPGTGAFFLWGFIDHDPELPQEQPLMRVPEYDVVSFDAGSARWRSHLPKEQEQAWSRQLPLAYIPRTYSGITSGSERTIMRGDTADAGGTPRPDLNIAGDQVVYHPGLKALVYFTGGLTAAYSPELRRWSDLHPRRSPPPVMGGSLAWDPVNREIVLFGGGHVAERDASGKLRGYTGTWIFQGGTWQELRTPTMPPPRMNSRLVTDERNGVLVLFGGDGQSHYLGDTWLYDLKTRTWRQSKAKVGPEPRAGHFAVYDPVSGLIFIGGGYNHRDLHDMWVYDAARDEWSQVDSTVPAGYTITADIDPEERLILLVTNTRRPGDESTCNVLYPVRTTYGFRLDSGKLSLKPATVRYEPISRYSSRRTDGGHAPPASIPPNQWVALNDGEHGAPVRTWGSATFDSARGLILYWGGGHCGYNGNDVDIYDVGAGRWRAGTSLAEYPERLWDPGSRLGGVTFQGAPWTNHGRRVYAHDPVSGKLVMYLPIRLTSGYDPEALKDFPADRRVARDALIQTPSSYLRAATMTLDLDSGVWELAGPAPVPGLDTLVSTPRGVMAVNVNWRARLSDTGYQLTRPPDLPATDASVYLYDAIRERWSHLGGGTSGPQNLYEMTSLAYDTKRQRLLLHGGGENRDELWAFDIERRTWTRLTPPKPWPTASREAVYLPPADRLLICGPAPEDRRVLAVWSYDPERNAWQREAISFAQATPQGAAGQNRAMVYDEKRDLVLLVLGDNHGNATVYGLRYER